jgi:hypothetical protein
VGQPRDEQRVDVGVRRPDAHTVDEEEKNTFIVFPAAHIYELKPAYVPALVKSAR